MNSILVILFIEYFPVKNIAWVTQVFLKPPYFFFPSLLQAQYPQLTFGRLPFLCSSRQARRRVLDGCVWIFDREVSSPVLKVWKLLFLVFFFLDLWSTSSFGHHEALLSYRLLLIHSFLLDFVNLHIYVHNLWNHIIRLPTLFVKSHTSVRFLWLHPLFVKSRIFVNLHITYIFDKFFVA